MTAEQEFADLFKKMYDLCIKNDWGDPFSYAVSRAILIANYLGHKKATTYSGADGIDSDGECEYKSTISKNINATYNGISVQSTWEEQEKYLKEQKIEKYKNHYVARFENGEIDDVWKLYGTDVFNILLPKLKKKFSNLSNKKDPRLGASLTKKEIYNYGIQIR
jgi:hypothetical protein